MMENEPGLEQYFITLAVLGLVEEAREMASLMSLMVVSVGRE